jgi:hypothetical protein
MCYQCIPVEFRFFARQSSSSRQNLKNLKRSPVAPGIEMRTRNIQVGIRGGTASMPLERRSSAQCSLQEKVIGKYQVSHAIIRHNGSEVNLLARVKHS